MKKIVTTIISVLMMVSVTSFADNSESVSLEKQYRDSLFSIVKKELDISKSDLVKNSDAIKEINEYVSNSIDLEVGLDEFESMIRKEVNSMNANSNLNSEDTDESKSNKKENYFDEQIEGYISYAKNFVAREYDISRKKLNTLEFENYVQDIFDEYLKSGSSMNFEEFFRIEFRESFEKHESHSTVIKVLGILSSSALAFLAIFLMIKDFAHAGVFGIFCLTLAIGALCKFIL